MGTEADRARMGADTDDAIASWWLRRTRAAASPGTARDLILMNSQIDVRHVLPTVSAPTLVLHRSGDRDSRVEEGRYLAAHIPGARFVELPGSSHLISIDADQIVDEVEVFLTGVRRGPDPDRVLATILFTDLVGSTETAVAVGDSRWAELVAEHHAIVRRELHGFAVASSTSPVTVSSPASTGRRGPYGVRSRSEPGSSGSGSACGPESTPANVSSSTGSSRESPS